MLRDEALLCPLFNLLQRGYDQVVHDVAIQNLSVRFAIDRAGFVGADGSTHAGALILVMSNLPGMVVMAAADEAELCHMVATAGPMTRAQLPSLPARRGRGRTPRARPDLEIGKGYQKGSGIAFLSFGTRLGEIRKACAKPCGKRLNPTVADARFSKPLDREMILSLAKDHEALSPLKKGPQVDLGQVMQLLSQEGVLTMA